MTRPQWIVIILGLLAIGLNLLVTRDITGDWQRVTSLSGYLLPDILSRTGAVALVTLGVLWMTITGRDALCVGQKIMVFLGIALIFFTAYHYHWHSLNMSPLLLHTPYSDYPVLGFLLLNEAAFLILLIAIIGLKSRVRYKLNIMSLLAWALGFVLCSNSTIEWPIKYLVVTLGLHLAQYFFESQRSTVPQQLDKHFDKLVDL